MATDSLCLENIDEFVNDENKIVTCKWLSLNLKIHINQAKRQLHTFLQQQRQKAKDITATYFLAGLVKGDNGSLEHMCQVVAEEDLELARAQLEAVTSCHVYSVQRAKLKDSNSLYMTDYESVKEHLSECNKYTSIHCKRASVPRAQPGRGKTQTDKSQKDTRSKGSNLDTKKDNVGSGDKADTAAPSSGKGKKTAAKGSLEAMFAQSNKKAENDGDRKKEDHLKEESKENKPAHKKGSVMDMFANAKPAAKTKAPEEKAKPDKTVTKEKPEAKDTKTQGKKPSKRAPRQTDDSDSEDRQQKKKRRRIQNDLFDSSSEEEDVELIPPSPEPSPMKEDSPEPESPVPSKKSPTKQVTEKPHEDDDDKPAPGGKLRRRKKKLVPKTYLDDEGFMVTEKVWETESTDASEVDEDTQTKPPPPKKPASSPAKNTKKPSPQKKKGSPAKGKQASIMSFFKKQ